MMEHVCPVYAAMRSERKLRKQIDALDAAPETVGSFTTVAIEIIEQYQEQEKERRKDVEKKGATILLAISLSVSVMFSVLGLLSNHGWLGALRAMNGQWIWGGLVFLAFYSLLNAGLCGLQAIRVGKLYGVGLEQERDQLAPESRRELVALCVLLNQKTTMAKANYVEAGYIALRNGVLLLGIGLVMAIIVAVRSGPGDAIGL